MRPVIVILALIFTLPNFMQAHPSGISFEHESGQYLLDMGYDPATFVTDEYTVFDFTLYRNPGKEVVKELDHVWVRIEDAERGTVFASGVRKASIGPTTLLVSLVRPGEYTISASYRTKNGEELASSRFPFTMTDTEPFEFFSIVLVALGLIAGILLGAFSKWLLSLYTLYARK